MRVQPLQFQLGVVECIKPEYGYIRPITAIDGTESSAAPKLDLDIVDDQDILVEWTAADEVTAFCEDDSLTILSRDARWPSFEDNQLSLISLPGRESRRLLASLQVDEVVLYLLGWSDHQICPIWVPQKLMVTVKSIMNGSEGVPLANDPSARTTSLYMTSGN